MKVKFQFTDFLILIFINHSKISISIYINSLGVLSVLFIIKIFGEIFILEEGINIYILISTVSILNNN